MRRAFLLTFLTFLTFTSGVFAQTATSPAGLDSPQSQTEAGRPDRIEQKAEEQQDQMEQRRQKLEEKKAEIQARRTEKQKQIIDRMKQKLSAVIDRLNNVSGRLKNHIAKIRARDQGEKVESALAEAEKHIGLAETEIANVKSKLSELDSTDKPKDVAQTFRTGVRSIHSHFKEARTNLVAALKALREAAKESRPTKGAESTEGE